MIKKRNLILFQSTYAVIKADRVLTRGRIPIKVIPVPREVSSECGLAIEYAEEYKETIRSFLTDSAIEFTFYQYTS